MAQTTPTAPGQGRLRTWPTADPDQIACGHPTDDSSCGRWGSRAWGRRSPPAPASRAGAARAAERRRPARRRRSASPSRGPSSRVTSRSCSGATSCPATTSGSDPFAQDWGKKVGVNVTVDHIDNAQIPTRIAAEIQAGQGHDVIQYIAPLSQFEPSVLDLKDVTDEATKRWGQQLELSKQSSFNPATGKLLRLLARLGARPRRLPHARCGTAVGHAQRARPPGTSCCRAAPRSRRPRAPSSASACPRRSTPTWPAGR